MSRVAHQPSSWSMLGFANSIQQAGRGVIFRIADNCDSAAIRQHRVTLGHRLLSVVGPFSVNVWTNDCN